MPPRPLERKASSCRVEACLKGTPRLTSKGRQRSSTSPALPTLAETWSFSPISGRLCPLGRYSVQNVAELSSWLVSQPANRPAARAEAMACCIGSSPAADTSARSCLCLRRKGGGALELHVDDVVLDPFQRDAEHAGRAVPPFRGIAVDDSAQVADLDEGLTRAPLRLIDPGDVRCEVDQLDREIAMAELFREHPSRIERSGQVGDRSLAVALLPVHERVDRKRGELARRAELSIVWQLDRIDGC